jgi:ferric-dicitrate binding protein FerR (iron transport regulator)
MNMSKIFGLIYELIRKYRDNELQGEVKRTADIWYDSYDLQDEDEAGSPWSDDELAQLRAKTMARAYGPAWQSWGIGVAASVLLLSLAAYIGWKNDFLSGPKQEVVAGMAPLDLLLPDGSRVHLEPGSTLQYPDTFSDHERLITLTGSAFFEVTKDQSRPFKIRCGDLQTQVLGTSFNVRSEASGNVTVVVVSGRVALTAGGTRVVLEPHEQGLFRSSEKTISKSRADTVTWNKLIADHYNLNFNNARLSDVLHTLEIAFDVTFALEPEGIGNCMFTADLSGQSLEMVLRLASQTLGFQYTINGQTVTIRGKGCS